MKCSQCQYWTESAVATFGAVLLNIPAKTELYLEKNGMNKALMSNDMQYFLLLLLESKLVIFKLPMPSRKFWKVLDFLAEISRT